jgi:hypothetical protein
MKSKQDRFHLVGVAGLLICLMIGFVSFYTHIHSLW